MAAIELFYPLAKRIEDTILAGGTEVAMQAGAVIRIERTPFGTAANLYDARGELIGTLAFPPKGMIK